MRKHVFKQTYMYTDIHIHTYLYTYTHTHLYFLKHVQKIYGKIHRLLQSRYGDSALKECSLYFCVLLVIFKHKYVLHHKHNIKQIN